MIFNCYFFKKHSIYADNRTFYKKFSIQNLYESVWQEPFYKASANTIMVHIRKLRSKIEEDPQNPKIIRTVWGKGYTFG